MQKIALPFTVTNLVYEDNNNKVKYDVKIKSNYEELQKVMDIVMIIPVPLDTISSSIKTSKGKCKYMKTLNILEWKITNMMGQSEATLKGNIKRKSTKDKQKWFKTMKLKFGNLEWCVTGFKVRFLKVQEPKLKYKSTKWVKYFTGSGEYEIQI